MCWTSDAAPGSLPCVCSPMRCSITGVDSSPGMLDMLNRKIKKLELTNVKTKLIRTETDELIEGRYNLIVSSMTFHHISNIKSVLKQLSGVALPSAYLCVADLDSEGGLFHGDNTGVSHYGFDREALSRMFMEAGFEKVRHRTAARVTKPIGDDKIAEFSVFLIVGRNMKD